MLPGPGFAWGRLPRSLDDRVEFALGQTREVKATPTPKITLALAIFKFDRMEWAIEKCTEIGVARIIPVIARRSDAHLAAGAAKRHERWQRIIRQAAEQSRRSAPPEIAGPVKLRRILLGVLPTGVTRVVLAESLAESEEVRLADVLQSSRSRLGSPSQLKWCLPWGLKVDGPTRSSLGSANRDGLRLRSATQFCVPRPRRLWLPRLRWKRCGESGGELEKSRPSIPSP